MAPKYKSSNDDNAKTDMERLGYFSEAGYSTIGDKYPRVDPNSRPCRGASYKGKQMMTTGNKTRSAQQAGYFEPVYKRIMEKEAFSDPVQLRRQQRLKKAKKIRGRGIWIPSDGAKCKNYNQYMLQHKTKPQRSQYRKLHSQKLYPKSLTDQGTHNFLWRIRVKISEKKSFSHVLRV